MSLKVHIIRSEKSWIEGEAIRQLEAVAEFPGMLSCVGMPDLHPAKGGPNGAAFLSEKLFPILVGNDIGCGVGLWMTLIPQTKINSESTAAKLNGLDKLWKGDSLKWLTERNIRPTNFDCGLGTPGFSNHFIELQRIHEIYDRGTFTKLGMEDNVIYITVHSGSRGFGESIMDGFAQLYGAKGVLADSKDGRDYLEQSNQAMAWAIANRELCAHRICELLNTDRKQILDICHNSVTTANWKGCSCWLHRKGAAPSDKGPVLIPGSRNALSYIVQPVPTYSPQATDALWSLAHGAGRKIARSDAYGKLLNLYRNKNIKENDFGGRVICGQKELLFEEAPECYKKIDVVIDDLVNAGLVSVIATLCPLVTFKTSERTEEKLKRDKKGWQQERKQARKAKHER